MNFIANMLLTKISNDQHPGWCIHGHRNHKCAGNCYDPGHCDVSDQSHIKCVESFFERAGVYPSLSNTRSNNSHYLKDEIIFSCLQNKGFTASNLNTCQVKFY